MLKNYKASMAFFLYSLLFACVFATTSKTLVIAHACRGVVSDAECTKTSLHKLITAGILAIECDVAKTKDDVIVLLHPGRQENSAVTSVLPSGEHCIHVTLSELRITKPDLMTLEELLKETPNKITIALDFKERGLEELVARIIQQNIAAGHHTDTQFFALSWYDETLAKLKQLLPFIKIFPVYVTGKTIEHYQAMHVNGVVLVNKTPGAITLDLVNKLKAAGLGLIIFHPHDGPKETINTLQVDALLMDNAFEYAA